MDKEEELPTLKEVMEMYGRGEIKEGNWVVCRIDEQYGGKIWMPFEEIKLAHEWQNSEEYKQKEIELFYGK